MFAARAGGGDDASRREGPPADARVKPRGGGAADEATDGDWLLRQPDDGQGLRVLHINRGGAGEPLAIKRERVRAGVFQPGHNLPTMTLDQLADIEIADAMERSRKAKDREHYKPTIAEDTRRRDQIEEQEDEEDTNRYDADNVRRADEAWAVWKESNKPGSGNRGTSQL